MSASEISERHLQLYQESKERQERRDKWREASEAREKQEIAAKLKPTRRANPERIQELFEDAEKRQKGAEKNARQAEFRELQKANQLCACGYMFSGMDLSKCPKCGAKRLESAGATGRGKRKAAKKKPVDAAELFSRHTEALKSKEDNTARLLEQEVQRIFQACACGHVFEANGAGRCRWCGAKRLSAEANPNVLKDPDEPNLQREQ